MTPKDTVCPALAFAGFVEMLPEATFLRIDAPGKAPEVYTITLDRYFRNKNFISEVLEDPVRHT